MQWRALITCISTSVALRVTPLLLRCATAEASARSMCVLRGCSVRNCGCAADLILAAILLTLSLLAIAGCGLPPGPNGLLGAAEGVSYLVVTAIASWSVYNKVRARDRAAVLPHPNGRPGCKCIQGLELTHPMHACKEVTAPMCPH